MVIFQLEASNFFWPFQPMFARPWQSSSWRVHLLVYTVGPKFVDDSFAIVSGDGRFLGQQLTGSTRHLSLAGKHLS